MSNKRKALAVVIFLFLLVAFAVVYILSELYNEDEIKEPVITDAIQFKEEYEGINGEIIYDKKTREVSIDEDNPMTYISAEDLVKKIDKKDSFVVYFGFNSCPWCRSIIEALIESAKNNKIEKVYYVDVKNIRDKYELDKNNKAIKTVEGTKGYKELLDRLNPVLSDYSPLFYKTKKNKLKEVKIKEKRIYAPNTVLVKEGKPLKLVSGIPKELTDPYMELTKEMKQESISIFNNLFESLTNMTSTCDDKNGLC